MVYFSKMFNSVKFPIHQLCKIDFMFDIRFTISFQYVQSLQIFISNNYMYMELTWVYQQYDPLLE